MTSGGPLAAYVRRRERSLRRMSPWQTHEAGPFDGAALALAGNHEEALMRAFEEGGQPPGTGAWVSNEREVWPIGVETLEWLATLPAHLVVDGGTLLAVHAGIAAADVGTLSARVHSDAQWGPDTRL